MEDPDCDSRRRSRTRKQTTTIAGGGLSKPTVKHHSGQQRRASRRRERSAKANRAGSAGRRRRRRRGTLGDTQRRRRHGGGLKAPAATARGDQPLAEDGNGGSPFDPGGAPTGANPTTTFAPFGPAPIGVPNFVINSFEIPPFLLPIYQACGTEYGIPWEVLAAINKIETGFGTNLNVSSAGAVGWMQFLPSSWETFGLDANGDGRKDPYNPVDAICAAAHYLKIAGGAKHLYGAILAYNHADWYAQEVLLYARAYGRLPADLVGSLTGLTEGAHFPIAADARYADDNAARATLSSSGGAGRISGSAAEVISSSPTKRGINIFAAAGSPVVAVNDGVIRKLGESAELGRYVVLEDTYGNRYTYAQLGAIVRDHRSIVMPSGKEKRLPVQSENLRPRLRALPGRSGKPEPARPRARPGPRRRARRRLRDAGAGRRQRNPKGRVEGYSWDRAGQGRQGGRRHRPAPELLDPAGRQGRSEHRPEADPRRLEAA